MIDVNFSPVLHPYTGNQPTVTVEGGAVGECISQAVERFPKLKRVLYNRDGSVNRNINIYINEADAYPDPLSKPLHDGDRLRIVMVIGGG
jgi:molybdopterin converting factor small subunit